MKSLNNQEILDEVSKVTQKIKETQLHISENLCKVLTAFESSNAEDLQKEILAIKKYNPEAYQEYLKVRSKLRLHEKKERKENSLNQDSSISSSQEQLGSEETSSSLDTEELPQQWVERYSHDLMLSRQIEKVCGWAQMELSGGVRTFYEEDEAVFVPQLWDAHVLRKKGDSLEKTGQKYYEIKKFGDFYVGIQIKTEKSASGGEQKVDGSETYFLLDKQGNQIKQISSKEFYSLYNEMDQAQNSLEEVSEEKMDLNIEFVDSYTKTVKKITTPEGKVIFDPSDDFRYDLQSESQPEKGLFLLQGVSNDGTDVEKSCFINASEDVSLTFDTPFVFMKGKLIEHYFSKNDADLYNTSGEKLGTVYHHRRIRDAIVITDDRGKYQIAEQKTGELNPQKFDEIVYEYSTESERIVIVRDEGNLKEIHIRR